MLHLRNTLTRRIEPVVPLEARRVRMYTCGPTVYRYVHVGNLRSFILPDLIRRALLYHGIGVFHVKNITDVGHLRDERFDRGADPMLVQAGLESKTPAEIAAAYEASFHADEAAVNVLPAHVFPRATEHVPEMIQLASRLVDLGHAYETDAGNVYFAVRTFAGYGRLSGNSLPALRAGHRGEVEPDKRDPADFALWKSAGEGRLLRWPTPRWGEGFPGWHLECSAMAMHYLGERFDIHTGGIDNLFPHHEDEIAQSAPIVGGVPATLWVHGEHLLMRGQKMAKSAGNFQRITELAADGIDPLAFRYLCLTTRYGRKLNYSPASLLAAAAGVASLRARLRAMGPPPADGPWAPPSPLRAGAAGDRPAGIASGLAGHGSAPAAAGDDDPVDRAGAPGAPLSPRGRELHQRFVAALDDDLDLPRVLAVIRDTVRADLALDERRWLVLDADFVLGLDLDRTWAEDPAAAGAGGAASDESDVERLLAERTAARSSRDFARADEIRRDLASMGYEITDEPGGGSTVHHGGQRS
jgi:cysteinyl-tRNA synthetase